MKKSIAFGIITILLLAGSTIAGIIISNKTNNFQSSKSDLVNYFGETVSDKFAQGIGQPREGISPPMLLDLFPNLKKQDLDNVQTALGYYKYEDAQLVYKPVGPQTHSAAQTITEEGFETLLDNLAQRFNIELKNKQLIDRIIERLYEETSNTNALQFRTISKNSYNLLTEKTEKIIKSQGVWATLWSSLSPTDDTIPQINFNEKMIIAVFQGQKSTGSYEIEIIKILEKETYLEIFVKETSPGVNCGADEVITSPYHIVELNKSDKEVRFTFEQKITNC